MTENQEFDAIYNNYKKLVMQAAYLIVNDLYLAEDIMQETFMALRNDMEQKGFEREEDYSNIKAWLYTTAKHKALNLRKKERLVIAADMVEGSELIDEPVSESLEAEYFDTVEEENRVKFHERIFVALMKKNPRWHDAIVQVCYMDVPVEVAARRLGMTENAFYVMMHRARKWIHKKFDVEYEELERF